ncbi:LCP family glycopolymer transferase [Alteribacter natronophilus]|uniref:LCP family glycopolymer transferase n=1 Tax=Alteribacter natronophilus TaxID=2583810 RepID=UPI00110ED02D|nr:LCP family protein [Alteribacter natronophilus]TMW72362.1 LytR family transcriptional regulator [Alteribacter natronophilus]
MTQSRIKRRKQRKRTPFKRFLKVTSLTLLTLIAVTGGYLFWKVNEVSQSAQVDLDRGEHSDYRDEAVNPNSDPFSVLILGLDTRDGDLSGISDAMVLATFNPEDGSIKMLNIPRDSRVEIVGRDRTDKINHAHAFGGVDMSIATVENLLNIPVDYFVSLNFDAFMKIINELGGVEVDVPMTFTETDNATYGTITLEEGRQTLNGEEALAYVRMRKSDPQGDLGRGERQKEVIESVVREAASFSSITRFGPLMDALEGNLYTNMSFNNVLGMHSYANDLDQIDSLSLDGTNSRDGGIYYYILNEESVADTSSRLRTHLELEENNETAESESTSSEY